MKPKFTDTLAWQQAELLMQPAFLRILDHIRKQLEQSAWKATYQEVQTPYPGYLMCLTYKDQQVTVDLWDLCFQVCFRNYHPTHAELESQEVEIDSSLIDEELHDVDWHRLDAKAQQLIEQIFTNLPTV